MAKRLNETSKSDDEDFAPTVVVQRQPGKRPVHPPVDNRNAIGGPAKPLAGSKRAVGEQHVEVAANEPNKRKKPNATAPRLEVVPETEPSRKSPPPLSGGIIEEIATNPPAIAVPAAAGSGTQDHPMDLDSDDDQPRAATRNQQRRVLDDDSEDDAAPAAQAARKGAKATKPANAKERVDPRAVDDRGLLEDLGHIHTPEYTTSASDKTRDIRAHFSEPRAVSGQSGKVRDCNACKRKKALKYSFTDEHSTLRRHMEASHEAQYTTWCKENNFESKLPKFLKAKRAAEAAKGQQPTLDDHLQPMPEAYSEEVFRQAVLEWLAATDQPLEAVQHKTFVTAEHTTLAGTGAEEGNYASKNMGGALTRPNLGISPGGRPPYIHIMRTPERDYPGSPYCLERGRRSGPKPAMSSKSEVARRITHNRTRPREPSIEQALDISGYASKTPRRIVAYRRPS